MDKLNEFPSWLKSVDNGKIGEARTKALLIDRFWILERNVDIEGADFIIQRKILGQNLLDKEAPRLGYVQSKFCGSDATSIHIRQEYVEDSSKKPRTEFFLLVHSGVYEEETVYFLEATRVIETFRPVEGGYSLSFGDLRNVRESRVVSRALVLDTIDHALKLANFNRNRAFYYYLTTRSDENFDLDFDYTLPLSNHYGDLRKGFLEIREKTKRLVLDLESDIRQLNEALSKTDPLDFFDVIETGYWDFLEDYFYNNQEYLKEDLVSAINRHRRKVDLLILSGTLQNYLASKKAIIECIKNDIIENTSLEGSNASVQVRYNLEELKLLEVGLFDYTPAPPNIDQWGTPFLCNAIRFENIFVIWFDRQKLMGSEHGKSHYPEYALDKFEDLVFETRFGAKWYQVGREGGTT